MKQEDSTVWGCIWKISEPHLANLDHYEAVEYDYYYREMAPVFLADGSEEVLECHIYFGMDTEDGVEARSDYMDAVIEGARDCNLP